MNLSGKKEDHKTIVFGERHDADAFKSTATGDFKNWHADKPRLVKHQDKRGSAGMTHEGYYGGKAPPNPFHEPKNLVSGQHRADWHQAWSNPPAVQSGEGNSGLQDVLLHGGLVSRREQFTTSYGTQCTERRNAPPPAGPTKWKTRQPRHDPITGGQLRVPEAPFESVGDPKSRRSVNSKAQVEHKGGVLPPIDIVGGPRDGNLSFKGKRRKPREEYDLSANSYPAYMVPA
eukprot:Hpha_TRINITY_DN33556_c0_g1::TRINITY_DN33556_c0_g1_i1::g.171224::m.171224